MKPGTMDRNFTPTSTASVSFSEGTAGTSELLKISERDLINRSEGGDEIADHGIAGQVSDTVGAAVHRDRVGSGQAQNRGRRQCSREIGGVVGDRRRHDRI